MNKEAKFGPEPLKKGTWVSYEYDVWMLKEDENSDPRKRGSTNISNAVVETWIEVRERCFPLTIRSRSIGMYFEYYRKDLSAKTQGVNLNWPDIHRHYCDLFRKCIEADTKEEVCAIQESLVKFNDEILQKVRAVGAVIGVQVFR